MFLADVAQELIMVHRGEMFRGAPDSVHKVKQLAESGKIKMELNSNVTHLVGDGKLEKVHITHNDGSSKEIDADHYLALFGLSAKLGPIAQWGLNIDERQSTWIRVIILPDLKGIYAIGDMDKLDGKLKLIYADSMKQH